MAPGDHPFRAASFIIHARPSIYFSVPAEIWQVPLIGVQNDNECASIFANLKFADVSSDGRHGIAALGSG